ncbi:MAG: hypothetical protein Q4B40_04315 [Clostridia bacterium]|nr:hypothetical protein [Clostridia bacterium]
MTDKKMPPSVPSYTVSDRQFQAELEHYAKRRLSTAAVSIINSPQAAPDRSTFNDRWSLYLYGDTAKVVYIKHGHKPRKPCKVEVTPTTADERFRQSLARSKSTVFELAMCNEFQHFCTFTQDKTKRDRFDLKEFRKDFAMLVRNLNRNRDDDHKIKYLLIPEQHANGAWHMHGLLRGLTDQDLRLFRLSERLPVHIRRQLEKGEAVYDWTGYRRRFGYFTATEIKSTDGCAKYVTKYISKDLQKTVHASGEHLFFASQGLRRRECIVKDELGDCPYVNEWDYENDYVKVAEFKIGLQKNGQ